MTMRHGCSVQCACMSTCNADQTRPDPTRPDPFYLSPLRVNDLPLLPQLQKAVHRLWESAMTEAWMGSATDCELAAKTETNKTEPEEAA